MAAYLKHVVSLLTKPASQTSIINTVKNSRHIIAGFPSLIRHIHTEERLRIDLFRKWRQSEAMALAGQRDQFIEDLSKKISDKESTLLTDDVNTLLAVVDVNDLDLLEKALKKLKDRALVPVNALGPSVMVVYFILNQPDKALAVIKDEELASYFQGVRSYAILYQMLYNNGKFQEILDVFTQEREKAAAAGGEVGFPALWVGLVLAACFQLNNPESYKCALELLRKMTAANRSPTPRQRALVSALAMKQGDNAAAYEVCSPLAMRDRMPSQQGISGRSVQIMSLAKLGRVDDALKLLQEYANISIAMGPLQVTHDALDVLGEAVVDGEGTERQRQEFEELKARWVSEGRLASSSLYDLVVSPLPVFPSARGDGGMGGWGRWAGQQQGFSPRVPQYRPGFAPGGPPTGGQFQTFQRSGAAFQQGGRQFQQGGGQFQQGGGQFQQGSGQFQQGGGQFQQGGGQFQRWGGAQFQQGGGGQFPLGGGRFQQQQPGNQYGGGRFQEHPGQWQNRPGGWQGNAPRFGSPQVATRNEENEDEEEWEK